MGLFGMSDCVFWASPILMIVFIFSQFLNCFVEHLRVCIYCLFIDFYAGVIVIQEGFSFFNVDVDVHYNYSFVGWVMMLPFFEFEFGDVVDKFRITDLFPSAVGAKAVMLVFKPI